MVGGRRALPGVVIDCDPGIDDALGICAALGNPDVHVAGITTVFGNVSVEQATRNAARVLQLVGRSDIPLGAGHGEPLTGSRLPQRTLHGRDGLGESGWLTAAPPRTLRSAAALSARVVGTRADTVITLAPLTNLAHAAAATPGALRRLRAVTVMAGTFGGGSEFNLASDPAAARCLLASGVALRWIPLEVAAGVTFSAAAIEGFCEAHGRTPVARAIGAWLTFIRRRRGVATAPDAVAAVLGLDPALGAWQSCRVSVAGAARTGRLRLEAGIPNAQVCRRVNATRVAARLWTWWGQLATSDVQRATNDAIDT